MISSILNSTKKTLGIEPEYTMFDHDILTHINAAFGTLEQIGVAQVGGVFVEDELVTWLDLFPTEDDRQLLNWTRTYVFLKVKLLFDPPKASFQIEALENQIREFEWRINTAREYANSQEVV